MFDVIIVGAGPAGLSAALLLGRCCRRVLLCDSGTPRNGRSHALHGFLSRDGIPPMELRRHGREQLARYGVEYREMRVEDARPLADGFQVHFADGAPAQCRRLLLATGVCDAVPPVEGFDDCYGRSVFHCPYCDGWEVRNRRLALYARGRQGVGMALALRDWSPHVVLVTDGPARLSADDRQRLARSAVRVRTERLVRLEHEPRSVQPPSGS
jgi:thioredoxin reductase